MRYVIAVLALIVAGWMAFDGARALVMGDYVTPRSGPHAGKLGPWSGVVRAVGIEPRSTFMKLAFVAYGSVWLVVVAAFVLGWRWSWWAMLAAAAGTLWYLPFGTVLGIVQIALLLTKRG